MKLIIAVIKPFKLEEVREALTALGVQGLMVSEVKGYGRQSGHTEIYRGAEYVVNFVPKVKLELVVPDAAAPQVVETLAATAKTGKIGDGKIFVLSVEQALGSAPARPATKPCDRRRDRRPRTTMQGNQSMRLFNKLPWLACALAAGAAAAGPALAQEATEAATAEVVAEVVSNINSGDTAWMLTSSLLVLFMILPGLALFYGGLVRAKNMLSVLMQCTIDHRGGDGHLRALRLLVSFGGSESAFWGGLAKSFLAGVTPDFGVGHHPRARLRRLPDDLRLHHAGADRRRLRRADEVLGGDPVRDPLGDAASISRSPTWPGTRTASTSAGARWTSPAAPWCTSTPASRRWWARCSSGRASATARRSWRRTR